MRNKKCSNIVTQNSPPQGRQLELFPPAYKSRKPQIESIPGVSPRDRNRYQVVLGGKAICTRLDASDAAQLASLIQKRRLTDAIEFLEERGLISEQAQVFLLTAINTLS